MENVPDPKRVKFNPCLENAKNTLILYTLSCMARKNNMYVVADMGDKQPCDGTCDANEIESCIQKCPEDGILMYNTAVAFDREGYLVARYHKTQTYFENLNIPEETEYITFKTDFGTFGLIICFDSVFASSMILARDYNIDTLLFTTHWFDDIVPLNGIEWQQSWAIANKVNFLGANTQTPGNGSLGSGIYSKDYGALVYTYEPDGESKVLVTNVPLSKSSNFDPNPSITVIKEDTVITKNETGDAFPVTGYLPVAGPIKQHYLDYRTYKNQMEKYILVKLQNPNGQIEACHDKFCCKLTYSANDMNEDYYLGAFSGLNDVFNFYHWHEESCILVRCDPYLNQNCVTQPSRSNTIFKTAKLSAEFTAERIYPTVSKNKFRLASKREWKLEKKGSRTVLEFKARTDEPLLKIGLLGRCYQQDPPYVPWYKY